MPQTIIHYAPVGKILCAAEDSWTAVYTDEPELVSGCHECIALAQKDLHDHTTYQGTCLHCRQAITASGGIAWRRIVRTACPHCGRAGW